MRAARDRISRELNGMSPGQQVDHIRRESDLLSDRVAPTGADADALVARDKPPDAPETREP
jgi:hypothetical protein